MNDARLQLEQDLASHHASVRRYLRRLTRDEAQAEDLLQETMLDALTRAQQWRGEGSRRAWLLGIARHRFFHARRDRVPQVSVEAAADDGLTLETLGLAAGWGRPADPEALSSALEERSVVEHALEALDAGSREVVTLRDLEGLSGEETAAVLGVSLPAMKSRLHRARLELVARVRSALNPENAHG